MVKASSELYNKIWTLWRDDVLIKFLDFHACWDLIRLTSEHNRYFDTILSFTLELKDYGITSTDVSKRFEILEKRYYTWSSIVERDGVQYEGDHIIVTADDEVWDAICEEFEQGKIYRNDGNEHMWPELCGIFGPDSVRSTRNALIKPFNSNNTKAMDEVEYEDKVDGSRAMDLQSYGKSNVCNDIVNEETKIESQWAIFAHFQESGLIMLQSQ